MYNHLTVYKQMISGSFKNVYFKPFIYKSYDIYKEDLALNNLQWLICYKNQTNPTWGSWLGL